ncbi:MAG: hypothetical protein WCH65_08990 [bacterium]
MRIGKNPEEKTPQNKTPQNYSEEKNISHYQDGIKEQLILSLKRFCTHHRISVQKHLRDIESAAENAAKNVLPKDITRFYAWEIDALDVPMYVSIAKKEAKFSIKKVAIKSKNASIYFDENNYYKLKTLRNSVYDVSLLKQQ